MKNSIVKRWGISVLGTTIFITIAIATFTCFFIKNNHYDIVRATLNSRANPLVMSYFESDYYVYDGLFNDMANDFVNEFAHEFKTPIVSIKGLIGLMKTKKLTKEKEREYLEIIDEEINRLSLITTNVLNFSKLDNQEILSERFTYNVSEQIRRIVLLFERQWTSKNLTFKLDFDEFTVDGNEDMLKEVWVNLIDNAIKFSNENTEIEINVVKNDNFIVVTVSNEGVKILDEDKDKIFNKFYQADKSYSKTGNGIGLSIVKKIVSLHKGRVGVDNINNKTVFTVKLPC